VVRTFFVPADSVAWTDIWNVVGLRGTASDAYAIENVTVPMEYSVRRDRVEDVKIHNTLYAFRAKNLYASGFCAIALGLARGLLEGFKELAAEKKGKYGTTVLKDNAVAQSDVAVAEARIRSASAYVTGELADIYDEVEKSGALSPDQRMRIRLAATFGIQEAKTAADIAYHSAGATAIFASQPFERRYRDLHAVTQQIQGHKVHYQTVGSYLLGHEPDLTTM
jgi:alkylation response protein AidB-like acyl-CoA dehydrogenase